jgi:hypothetical protein
MREAEAFEDMRHDLVQIALDTGAIKLDAGDGETLLTQFNANAQRHAYALATIDCECGRWNSDIAEMKEIMRSVLEDARVENRDT